MSVRWRCSTECLNFAGGANTSRLSDTILRQPLDVYTSQDIFERELETLFSGSPLVAGHVNRVREPGSYMLSDWPRQPYFVVRGKDGVLRAFLNTCRHRGAPLIVREKDEPLRVLVCPFHGWTYGLDGALRGIPRVIRLSLHRQAGLRPERVLGGGEHGIGMGSPDPAVNRSIRRRIWALSRKISRSSTWSVLSATGRS